MVPKGLANLVAFFGREELGMILFIVSGWILFTHVCQGSLVGFDLMCVPPYVCLNIVRLASLTRPS